MSKFKPVFGLILMFMLEYQLNAQVKFENTLPYDSTKGSPPAKIEDVGWIAGYWIGEAMGGVIEEVWTPPSGGSMMCTFKLIVDGKVNFYEFFTISEQDESLVLKLRHFSQDFKAWENKDEYVTFRLVKLEPNRVFFNNFTIARPTPNQLQVYVVFKDDQGEVAEHQFIYQLKDLEHNNLVEGEKTELVNGIGGVFMKSERPDKLKQWYQEHLGIKMDQYGHAFQWRELKDPETIGFTQWGIFDRNTDYFNPSEKEMMLNLRVKDLDEVLQKLKEEGIEQEGKTEEYPYGKFAWIMDPEGNKVELWQPL